MDLDRKDLSDEYKQKSLEKMKKAEKERKEEWQLSIKSTDITYAIEKMQTCKPLKIRKNLESGCTDYTHFW